MAGSFNAIGATLYDKLNYNFIRDIAPVAPIMRTALVMVVNPTFPTKIVADFITYAKPTRASSTWGPQESVARNIWPVSYSR